MRRSTLLVCLLVFALALTVTASLAGSRSSDKLGIAVSPQTLLLSKTQSGTVTVHADIPYTAVDRSTLALNGVPVARCKADLRGDLVAMFDEAAIKAIVELPEAVLTLTGTYKDGGRFSGSDTVRVVE